LWATFDGVDLLQLLLREISIAHSDRGARGHEKHDADRCATHVSLRNWSVNVVWAEGANRARHPERLARVSCDLHPPGGNWPLGAPPVVNSFPQGRLARRHESSHRRLVSANVSTLDEIGPRAPIDPDTLRRSPVQSRRAVEAGRFPA
jgi:hypothetical protein